MKKTYIICFLCLVLFAYGIYKISYLISLNEYQEDIQKVSNYALTKDTSNVITNNTVSTLTEFTYETYNINTKELTHEKETGPMEYLGLTEGMLTEKLKEKTYPENVVKVELISFTPEDVIIRTTISYDITAEYFIKYVNETLVIYHSDKETVYDYADIDINSLPEILRTQVISGMYIESTEDLYEFLQNYSS